MQVVALNSRFSPPRSVHELLPRPEFIKHLEEHVGVVTMLVGPPGSGRTSVMTNCYQAFISTDHIVRWISLTYADNDVHILREHLKQAFFSEDKLSTEALADFPPNVTGFIDGVEWLDNSLALEFLQRFVLSVPASSRIMLSSGTLQGRLLSSAQLSGLVVVLGPKQLHLRDEEVAQILGSQYTAQQIRSLNEWAQGWPAGIRFMARDPEAALKMILTPEQAVLPEGLAEYIEGQFTQTLPSTLLEALMELSVLERFVPELIAELPDPACSWALVEELLRDSWILRYQDTKQHWVKVNPLLACHFSRRLRKYRPARYQVLKHFVARWLNDNGYYADAVRHALGLDEPKVIAQLVEEAGALSIELGAGPKVVLSELLTAEQAAQFPLVFIGQLYMRIRTGKINEAYTLFRQAWQLTEGFREIDPCVDSEEVRAWALLYEHVFRAMLDRPACATDLNNIRASVEQWLIKEPVLAAAWASILGYRLFEAERYQEAISVCDNGLKLSQLDEHARITVFLRLHKAMSALALGYLDEAWLSVSEALLSIAHDPEPISYERVCTHLAKGILLYHQDEVPHAYSLLRSTLSQLPYTSGWVPLYANGYAAAIDCACLQNDFDGAFSLLTEAERFAQTRELPRLSAYVNIMRVQLYIRTKNLREALQLSESDAINSLLYAEPSTVYEASTHLPAALVCAQLMLELGRPAQALSMLKPLEANLLTVAHCRGQMSYWILSARAHFAVRRYSLALEQTCRVYQLAKKSQIKRLFGVEYDTLGEIINWAKERAKPVPEGLFTWLKADSLKNFMPNKGLQLLSPRESDVMVLVSEGLTNKEIAQRLQISEGTVKGHRKRIHEKLGVNSRSQAIIKARELMLI